MGQRWGDEGPPPEAYSRVSDPSRYAALHEVALGLAADLERRYEVELTRRRELEDQVLGGRDPAVVPVLDLVPHDPAAAPVAIVLTSFPGVLVRAGHTSRTVLPSCGCDACDETLAEMTELLTDHVTDIVTHGLTERVVRDRGRWHEVSYPSAGGSSRSSGERVDRARAAELRAALPGDGITWAPWTPRASSSAPATTPVAADLDLRDLPEVQRRVVDHVVQAMFRPGELDDATVRVDLWADDPTGDEAPGLVVVFTDRDGDLLEQPLTVTGPRWATAAQIFDDLASSVEDWISETTYAWGERRTPPPTPRPELP